MPRAPELSRRKIHVAAGILQDPQGRVLVTDRKRATCMQEYWEFPGGKIRSDESAQDALRRELGEELGIEITRCEFLHRLEHYYPELRVAIEFYLVLEWQGTPSGTEGQALRWLRPDELSGDALLPADAPVLDLLRREMGSDPC